MKKSRNTDQFQKLNKSTLQNESKRLIIVDGQIALKKFVCDHILLFFIIVIPFMILLDQRATTSTLVGSMSNSARFSASATATEPSLSQRLSLAFRAKETRFCPETIPSL